jgi:WD40 repeat protein
MFMFPRKIYFWLSLVLMSCVQASGNIGSIRSFLSMNEPRAGHSATLLSNGKVLIAGGCTVQGCESQLTSGAELYDPVRQTFTPTGDLNIARVGHRAIALASGEVFIFGGWAGNAATAVVERYDPETETFELAGELTEPRDGFTATLLQDGRVLITGGYNGAMNRLSSAEIYDPTTQTSVAISPMSKSRMAHSASLLHDRRVLIVGGSRSRGNILSSAELFDPATGTFSVVGNLGTPRHKHAAVTLTNGSVLIVGGTGAGEFEEQLNSAELFNATTLVFEPTASMRAGRFKIPDAVQTFRDGNILIAGSDDKAEVYDASRHEFYQLTGEIGLELSFSTATLLANGDVFIAGGYDPSIRVTDKTWLYQTD